MPGAPAKEGVLMVMHGSPDTGYERAATDFVQAWRRQYPAIDATLCFLEHQSPQLADVMQGREAGRYRCLVPLFLNEGRHVLHDIPALVAGHDRLHVSRPLTDAAVIAGMMIERLSNMPNISGHLLIYSHGSRDDHHTVDQIADVLRERLAWPVGVVLASDGDQRLEEAMRQARNEGASSMSIVPHFLFEGCWRQRLEENVAFFRQRYGLRSIAITKALGEHPAMFALIEQRVRECLGQE